MVKKILTYAINTVSVLIIAAALFVLLSVVMTRSNEAPNVLGYSAFRVVSGSMEPTVMENDLIIVRRVAAEDIAVGDVISFYSTDPALGGAVNTHRVTAVQGEGAGLAFITRGDANQIDDAYPVPADRLLGRMVLASHALGVISRLAANPIVFLPLILLPLLAMLLTNMCKTVRLAKETVRAEEAEALRQALETLRQEAPTETAPQRETTQEDADGPV